VNNSACSVESKPIAPISNIGCSISYNPVNHTWCTNSSLNNIVLAKGISTGSILAVYTINIVPI
jgi:hypothetical protein